MNDIHGREPDTLGARRRAPRGRPPALSPLSPPRERGRVPALTQFFLLGVLFFAAWALVIWCLLGLWIVVRLAT